MLLVELLQPLSFRTESRGYHHGQHDLTLAAYHGHERVGYIDYSVWNDSIAIQMIRAIKRGMGIGPAMVHELQRQNPETEIDFGSLTDDGAKMLAKMPRRFVPNPDHDEKSTRLDQIKTQLASWQAIADAYYDNPTAENRLALKRIPADTWNDLHSEEWQIEQELTHMIPGRHLIIH